MGPLCQSDARWSLSAAGRLHRIECVREPAPLHPLLPGKTKIGMNSNPVSSIATDPLSFVQLHRLHPASVTLTLAVITSIQLFRPAFGRSLLSLLFAFMLPLGRAASLSERSAYGSSYLLRIDISLLPNTTAESLAALLFKLQIPAHPNLPGTPPYTRDLVRLFWEARSILISSSPRFVHLREPARPQLALPV